MSITSTDPEIFRALKSHYHTAYDARNNAAGFCKLSILNCIEYTWKNVGFSAYWISK